MSLATVLAYNERYAVLDKEQNKIVRDTFIDRHEEPNVSLHAAKKLGQKTGEL